MRSVSKQFPLPFTTMEEVIDVLGQRFCLITAKIKLPLGNDIVWIIAIIGNQCYLTDISCMGENNVPSMDKRI